MIFAAIWGCQPLAQFDFALKDGFACHLRYLSANKDQIKCDSAAQLEARRGYHESCHNKRARWCSVAHTYWLMNNRNMNSGDFMSVEHYDCDSEGMAEAFEQILGNPYNRIHLLQPYNTNIDWSSGAYKQKSVVYGINSRFLTRKYYHTLFGEQPSLDGYYQPSSYGVASQKLRTWPQKVEEYCFSTGSDEARCAGHVSQVVSNFTFSLNKLECCFR